MRTKTLLIAAAVLAAGIGSSVAQTVYSANIVGYVNVTIPTGFSIIANQLDNGTNDLNSLIPNANFSDTVFTWNGSTFSPSTYVGSWGPDATLVPGQAAFYDNTGTTPITATFVGQVMTGSLTNNFPSGFSLISDQVPVSQSLDTAGLPGNFGDTIFFYRAGAYVPETYVGTWGTGATPNVGEGFWLDAAAGGSWTQNFSPQ